MMVFGAPLIDCMLWTGAVACTVNKRVLFYQGEPGLHGVKGIRGEPGHKGDRGPLGLPVSTLEGGDIYPPYPLSFSDLRQPDTPPTSVH